MRAARVPAVQRRHPPPGGRLRPPRLQPQRRARLHQPPQLHRPGRDAGAGRRARPRAPARGGRRPLHVQPRAAGRLRRPVRDRRRRGGRQRDHRGRRRVEGQRTYAGLAPGGPQRAEPRPRRLRPVDVRRGLRRRPPGGRHAQVPRRPRARREAHHRRPRRLALSPPAARPHDRGRARPPQRRGLPGLHPGLPLLPGRDDHPPGARAPRRAGPHHGERRPQAHGLRRGQPHVAVERRLLGHRVDRHRHHQRPDVRRPGRRQPAQPAGRRLHRRHRLGDRQGPAHRPHLRPRGRHVAHAPGHQQAHPRGGPLRRRRVRLLAGLAAG